MKAAFRPKIIALSALAALTPSLAFAHNRGDHVHGFLAGIEHPVFGLDHLLAMVAVGMIAARTGGLGVLLVPLSFVAAMVAGAALGMAGIGLPGVETGIALSLAVFGAVVGLYWRLPLSAAAALVAMFGILHGHAHGLEAHESAGGIAYATGFVLSTCVLHAIGALSGMKLSGRPGALRAAGAGTSLLGLVMTLWAI